MGRTNPGSSPLGEHISRYEIFPASSASQTRLAQQPAHNEFGAEFAASSVAEIPCSSTCPKVAPVKPRDSTHTNLAASLQLSHVRAMWLSTPKTSSLMR